MTKPVINSIQSFDASVGCQVLFSLSGDVSYGNKIFVYNAVTLELVYSYPDRVIAQRNPVQLACTIPANKLRNGERYYAQVQIVDKNGVFGSLSDKRVFYCLTTPVLKFGNVEDGKQVGSSFIDVVATYDQENGEKLQSYRFGLYDKNKIIIHESDLKYDIENINYRFKNLATDNTYYIQCWGTTVRGLTCSTGMIEINPKYSFKQDYAQLNLKNVEYGGYIEYSTSIRLIGYNLDNKNYLFVGGAVDLTGRNPDYYDNLVYDNGFVIDGDWVAWIKVYGCNANEPILTYSNDQGQKIIISFHRYDGFCKFKLKVTDGVTSYIRYTQEFPYSQSRMQTIYIRRVDNLFDFRVIDGTEADLGDYSLYQDSDGNLFVRANGPMPYYRYAQPSLFSTEDVRYDSATGNAYLRV